MIAKNLSEWRKLVLERDNHICQICGNPANIADHIVARKLEPELLLDTDNGRGLCNSCHAKYGTKVYIIPEKPNPPERETRSKEPQPVDWNRELEPQLLCTAGDLRTLASMEDKSIQEFLPDKVLVITFDKYGWNRQIL